jgi:hypothetical protein
MATKKATAAAKKAKSDAAAESVVADEKAGAAQAAAEDLATGPNAGAGPIHLQRVGGDEVPRATDGSAVPTPEGGPYQVGDVVHATRADGTTHEGTVVDVVPGHVVRLKDGADTEEFVRASALKLAPRKG